MEKRVNNRSKRIESAYIELDELITRVLCDTAPPRGGKADAAYLFAETKDNENSAFAAVLLIWRLGRVKKIAICDLGNIAGYPGAESWRKSLALLDIPRFAIVGVKPAPGILPSTDAEALGLVRFAKKNKWKTIYVIAPPLHQLRAFVASVSFAEKENRKLKVYNFPGISQRWEEHVVHSQGILQGTRSELIGKELEKIERYCKEGILLSAKKILAYLDKRDN